MKIPEYSDNVSIQNVGPASVLSPDAAAAPWTALEQVGKSTYELQKVIQEKQDDILRMKDVSERTIAAEGKLSDLMVGLGKERDPATASQKFSEGFSQIKNDTLDGVNDYKVATALTQHLTSKEVAGVTQVKHAAWKWTLENNTADTQRAIDSWTKMAAADETRIPEALDQITGLVNANVKLGAWTPEAGRVVQEKSHKDLYAQVAAQIIMDDPENAPERISPLLAQAGLDPTAALSLESRAVAAQDRAERRGGKMGQTEMAATAANFAEVIKQGGSLEIDGTVYDGTEEGVLRLYSDGMIGDKQVRFLGAVLAGGTKDAKISERNVAGIMNDFYIGKLSAPVAARRIYSSADILPEHKDNALSRLMQIGKSEDKFPNTKDEALQILSNFAHPSGIMNISGDQQKKMNGLLGEFYDYYYGDRKKIDSNPKLLIDWARNRTKQKTEDAGKGSKYPTSKALYDAYDYYVARGGSGTWADWQAEADKWGVTLDKSRWPKGRP